MKLERIAFCALIWACSGTIEDADEDRTFNPDSPREDAGAELDAPPNLPRFQFEAAGEDIRPGLRRLTRNQLEAAWSDIAGVDVDLRGLPEDSPHLHLNEDASRLVVRGAPFMQVLFETALQAAEDADADALVPCDPCGEEDVRSFLEHAFVHPLSPEHLTRYNDAFEEARATNLTLAKRGLVLMALLAPSVIYRSEIGVDGTLSGYEIAEKLSYFLWGTPPDNELRDLARDDSLRSPEVRRAQVERMLSSPLAPRRLRDFLHDWLGTDHVDLEAKPGFEELPVSMAQSMYGEFRRVVDEIIFAEEGSVQDILLANETYVDANLASFYGVEAPADGWERISTGDNRLGVLTMPLVLSAHAKEDGRSPMQRGSFIVEELLCHGFPEDAGVAAMMLPADSSDVSFRDKFRTLEVRPDCAKCHEMINVGFAFDLFDNFGRRWADDFVPLEDAQGFFELQPYPRFEFSNVAESVQGLASHPALGPCFVAQLYRFAQGSVPSSADALVLETLELEFETGAAVLSLLRSIATSDRFVAAAD